MFKFIHTADWQIGAPFGSFEPDLSARLRAARIAMIDRVAALAISQSVRHVVVAGDVWDSEQPSDAMIRQPLDMMSGQSEITWWLMPGNHDPFRKNLLWSRIQERAPNNVRLLLEPEPVEAEPGVWFLPAPWASKFPGRDLTEWMVDADIAGDAIKIGIGHGSITDFASKYDGTSDAASKSVIPPDRADTARLDYLALGDWHGVLEIGKRVWYSGTPEPDRFRRNSPGHALIVSVAKGEAPKVTIEKTAEFDWQVLDLVCLAGNDAFPELQALEARASLRNTLMQIHLSGELTQARWSELERRLRALAERAAFLDIRDSALTRLVTDEDLDALDKGGSVRMAADRLMAMKTGDTHSASEKSTASDALSYLLSFAQEEVIQ